LVLFGSALFFIYGFTAGATDPSSRLLRWPKQILLIAAIAGLAGVMAWVMAQTALISDHAADALDPFALSSILTETRFGRICLLRLVLLGTSIVILWCLPRGTRLWLMEATLGGVVLASFAWTGHGAADEGFAGIVHQGSDILHLLSAGVWIGALVPLCILLLHGFRSQTQADARATYLGLESFSGIGPATVSVLLLSGLVNSWFMIGVSHWRELFTTGYGLSVVAKVALFCLMVMFAAVNRFWLTPRLAFAIGPPSTSQRFDPISLASAVRALRNSVLAETGLAMLVLAAVAYLGTLEPPAAG
jgi:copper resistance protein D